MEELTADLDPDKFSIFWIISHRIMRHRQRRALIWCFPGIPTADSFFRL